MDLDGNIFMNAVMKKPTDRLLEKGMASYNTGDYAVALNYFKRALQTNAPSDRTFIYLAHTYHSVGNISAATQVLHQAAKKHPECFQAYADLAKFLTEQRRYREAQKACQKAIRLCPKSIEMHMELARIYRNQDKTQRPIATYRKVIKLDPNHFSAHLELGSLLREKKSFKKARRALLKAIQISPQSIEARKELGRLDHALGNIDGANKTIRETIEQQQVNAALAYADKGDIKKAISMLQKILEANPQCFPAHMALGDVLCPHGRIKDSKRAYKRARASNPHSAEVHRKLGNLYLQLKDFNKAERYYRRSVQLEHNNPESHAALAQLLLESKQLKRAENIVKKPIKFPDPETQLLKIYCALGQSHDERGSLAKAMALKIVGFELEAALRNIIHSDPSFAPAPIGLATMLKTQGRFEEAKSVLLAALKQSGNSRSIRIELRKLDSSHKQVAKRAASLDKIRKGLTHKSKQSPRNSDALVGLFRFLMAHGKLASAFKVSEQAIHLDSNSMWELVNPIPEKYSGPPSYISLQQILHQLKRIRPSSRLALWSYFYQAVILVFIFDDYNPQVIRALGRIKRLITTRYLWMHALTAKFQLQRGSWADAIEDLQTILLHFPASWQTHCYMGEAKLGLGHTYDAMREFQKAALLSPDRGNVLAWRGEMRLWLGNYRLALKDLNNARRLGSDLALCWLGASLMKLGKHQKALRYLDEALNQCPFDAEAYLWRGEVKRYLGQHVAALADINKAIYMKNGIWAYFNRALIYLKLGRMAEMRNDFGYITRTFPELARFVADRIGKSFLINPSDPHIVEFLEAGLRLSRGNRRPERYATLISMATYR